MQHKVCEQHVSKFVSKPQNPEILVSKIYTEQDMRQHVLFYIRRVLY